MINDYTECQGTLDSTVQERPIVDKMGSFSQDWTVKAIRKRTITRTAGTKAAVVLVGAVGAVLTTLSEQSIQVQAVAYIFSAITILLINPGDFVGRFTALSSRVILSIMLTSIIATIIEPQTKVVMVAVLICGVGAVLIKTYNASWLSAENWRMSEQVQKVLSTLRNDTDNALQELWKAHGARETRTMIYQMGLDYDDRTVITHAKPVYMLGVLHGLKRQDNLDLLTSQLEEYKLNEQLQTSRIERLNEQVDTLCSESENQQELEYQLLMFQKMNRELKKENEELKAKAAGATTAGTTTTESVLIALDQGKSYRTIAEELGISKSTVGNIARQQKTA